MKREVHYFVIIILVIFINSAFSQITFQKTYGGTQDDYFYSVQQTADGGYIMVGATNSFGAGGYDVYLVKTNLNGDTLWTKTYGGTGNDFGYWVQQTTDSGYIIIGSTNSTGPGLEIIYLIKTDVNGNIFWTKTYKPVNLAFGLSGGSGLSVKQTFDGGFILDCAANVNGAELLLIKTDALGDTLWNKSYGMHVLDFGSSIQQTIDSGYIITGSRVGIGLGYDVYLLKTDVNGNLIWKKTYGGNYYDIGFSAQQTLDGGYIVLGHQDSLGNGVYLIKTDSYGDTLWTKAYGGDSSDRGFSIQLTNDSGYIIAGVTNSFGAGNNDVYLIKTNAAGNTLWTKTFGGASDSERSNSVQQTFEGGYILAGGTYSFAAGNNDAYLIKTDTFGNSGCHENGTATMVRAPTTIVALPTDTDYLAVSYTLVNSYTSLVGSGGTLNTFCTNVEINEMAEDNSTTIYPNPAQDNFTININTELINTKMEIYDMLGKNIYSSKFEGKQEVINCKEFSSGIYFVSLRTGNEVMTKKLIVKK